ncbi:MAG: Gfo/Idh/MocA family oxidoreductase [Caldilineaceae bacterium]|nr:Gfo/Idh/MocA family oxidoreductase [Caldilineaceae bacterium]
MTKVRWAMVGTSGFALDWLARGIQLGRNAELTAIVSRDAERGKAAAQKVGAPHVFAGIDAIDKSVVDGVFLCLPNTQHAPYAIAAAERGLHVICEKPMAPSLAACRAMIDAARANQVTLAVAHCMEWASPLVKARELLEQNAIGTVISATISASYPTAPTSNGWRQTDSPDAGGGILYDMGVHAVDGITRLLGPITQVAAWTDQRLLSFNTEDASSILARFQSGAHGYIQSHFTCLQNSLEIQGTEGRIWSNAWWGRDFSGDLHLQRGKEVTDFTLPQVNVYVPQIEHVSDCILRGVQPVISGERGLANIAVVRAAFESSRTGRVVDVEG